MYNEEQRQAALDAMNILDTPPDERVDRVTRLAKELFGVPMVSVSLIDRDRQWRKSQIGLGGAEAPRADSFCDFTVRQDASSVVEDASLHGLWAENPFVVNDPHLRFYAGHPLHAPGGEPVGTLCLLDTEPRAFSDAQRAVLKDLAFWVQTELARDYELGHAALIQQALRPRAVPAVPGWTIAAGTRASGQLSGDMYDLALHGEVLRVSLGDAMGKGVGPAIAAAFVRASLRTAPARSVSEGLAEADRLLGEDLATAMFVTAMHADISTVTGEVELVDAGHGLTYILRADGSWEQLRSTGLPLGMGLTIQEERDVTRVVLQRGDTLISCSDGLLDVLDPTDPFGHVARTLVAEDPEGAVREALLLAERQSAPDDVTVLVVRREV